MLFIPTSALSVYSAWTPPAPKQISTNLRLLEIPASYIAADLVNHRVLATLQGGIPGAGNSLLEIDGASGTVVSRTFIGAEPGLPAASSGGVYAYVPVLGDATVRRVRSGDGQADLAVPLTPSGALPFRAPYINASQILPLPGQDESYAVIQEFAPESDDPYFDSLVVYDRDARRPKIVTDSQTAINSGSVSADGSRIFGLEWQSNDFTFSRAR